MKGDRRVLKRIRLHCLACCGDSTKEVRFCPATDCELWPLRFGSGRKAAIRRLGKAGKDLLDETNFLEGSKFSPNKSVAEIEP